MGYKLAGFDVIGCNEIDQRMMDVYWQNHHPKYSFCEPIQEFSKRDTFPEELYELDVLDGSPPCSTFSMSGSREAAWGKEKHFREGQAAQVLDTLFFDFIDLAKKLQPKVVVAENVKGLLLGEAKKYVRRIYEEFDDAGYYVQHFLLDAQRMGVPQRRERVFFVCLRKDIAEPLLTQVDLFAKLPILKLDFNEAPIKYGEIADRKGRPLREGSSGLKWWRQRVPGERSQKETIFRLTGKEKCFNQVYLIDDEVCPTLSTKRQTHFVFDKPVYISKGEIIRASSFPSDFDFLTQPVDYVCGMSVPPVMMAQVATEIYNQWLAKL